MATLYVTEPGARIEKEYQRILVTLEGEVIQSVPLRSITEVVIIGVGGATTQALLALLDQNIGLTFLTRTGKLRGRLRPAGIDNLALRLNQYDSQKNDHLSLEIAKNIVVGKLLNYKVMAQRIMQSLQAKQERAPMKLLSIASCEDLSALQEALDQLKTTLAKVQTTEDILSVRGMEGVGSKLYFKIFRSGLRWEGQSLFERRQKRPPKDPVNALLSFGYTLLCQSITSAIEIVGLDPQAGFLHNNQYGRPSLALDLMEEFRPLIVDSIVLRLVNLHMITPKQFETGENGSTCLTRKGLKTYLNQYHQRINTLIIHPRYGKKLTYQKCFEVQARLMRSVIEGKDPIYRPMKWR